MSIDSYMIPITISICLISIAPFIAPEMNLLQTTPFEQPVSKIQESEDKSKKYFDKLEENVKDTKETIRDLMAEHNENNP